MKRSWIGLGILLVLLAVSLLVTGFMTRIHEDVSLSLAQSVNCAGKSDWDNAEFFFNQAKGDWETWDHLRASFADHNPVEEIDADFAALEVYLHAKDPVTYRAACSSLVRRIRAVGEAHELVWWNLL